MNTRTLGIIVLFLTFLVSSCSKDSTDSIKTFDVELLNYKSIKTGGVIESSSSSVIQREGYVMQKSHNLPL